MAEHSSPTQTRDEEIDLARLTRPLWRHRWRFFFTWVLLFVIALGLVGMLKPKFQAGGTVFIEEKEGNSALVGAIMPLMPGLSSGDDLESSKSLISTRELGIKTISKLGLNAELDGPAEFMPARPFFFQWFFDRDPANYDRGLHVDQVAVAESMFDEVKLTLRFTAADRFAVLLEDERLAEGTVGELVKMRLGSFVTHYPSGPAITPGTEFELKLVPNLKAYESFSKALEVAGGGSLTAPNRIIEVKYRDRSPARSAMVVDTLIEEFIALKHDWAIDVTQRTLDFISLQIDQLKGDMDEAFGQLAEYQEESGTIALSPQAQAELTRVVETEIELSRARMTQEALAMLEKSLESGDPDLYLMAGVDAPMVQASGQRLSQLNAEIAALKSQFQDNYPPLQQRLSSRESLLKDLKSSVRNLIENARTTQVTLSETLGEYRGELSQLPGQAKLLAEFERKTRVFEGLYMTLVQERQKAQIAKESTMTNVRRVDRPRVPIEQQFPNLPVSVVVAFALSGFLAAVRVTLPALRARGYESAEDVRSRFAQPVFAVMPFRTQRLRRGVPNTLEPSSQTPFMEAIRLLRANILHTMAGRTEQVILLTSAMPEDGKTSVAINIAASMTRSGRRGRVLIVDADMHKPTLHSILGIAPTPGLSDYLNGQASLDEIIHTVELPSGDRFDVIVAGPVPPTPGDLVETDLMRQLIETARERYTFTFLDSPPYPLIATASILAPQVDRILSICRLNKTDRALYRRHVKELTTLNRQVGLVVNAGVAADGYAEYGYGKSAYGYMNGGRGGSGTNGQSPKQPVVVVTGDGGRITDAKAPSRQRESEHV